MVIERTIHILPFLEWFGPASALGLAIIAALIGVGLFWGYLVAARQHGPSLALTTVLGTLSEGIRELLQFSPRRLWAMSVLAFREAIRRKVLVVFAVFTAILLFAGWFLDLSAEHPAELYLSFVLATTNYSILMLAVLLSCFSLPNDLKNRTIYTITTKPVRAWEIVLGRIVGFSAIGTLLLLIMGICSYFFVVRGLSHGHDYDLDSVKTVQSEFGGKMVDVKEALSTNVNRHRHSIRLVPDGSGNQGVLVDSNRDHTHAPLLQSDGQVSLGKNEGDLLARVPRWGKLSFLNADGQPANKGVNVGNEWEYRSFIEGGTLATAIYTFDKLDPVDFKDGIPLEMTIRVFRTYQGQIERGIFGSIEVVEPSVTKPGETPTPLEKRRRFSQIGFTAREFTQDRHVIPLRHVGFGPDGEEIPDMHLFDLVKDGKLEIWVRCGERAQYFGFAQPDLYIRSRDGYFLLNFVKGFLGIWFQMVIVTSFAVMFSTFLNGSVALLATLAAVFMGFVADFVMKLFTGNVDGGGPSESLIRLVKQSSLTVELAPGVTTIGVKTFDYVVSLIMAGISSILPKYGNFDTSAFVASGFNIQDGLVAQHALITLVYVIGLTTAGYFLFKTKEIAA